MAPRKHTFSRKPQDVDRIARALLDAQLFGDKRAAELHGVHFKTIVNWRGDEGPSEEVRAAMDVLRTAARAGWIDEARDARRVLVQLTLDRARKSKNLRSTTEALRRVNEVVMAHEILSEPGADAEPHLPDQPADPGEAQGED